jgi:quercetin dioxygenase-like cupin family protein
LKYTDTKSDESAFIREFSHTGAYTELEWHQDEFTRELQIIDVGDWYLQIDNEAPQKCNRGDRFQIPRLTWHRLIGSSGRLVVSIKDEKGN